MSSPCIEVNLEDYNSFYLKYVDHVDRTVGSFYSDENKLIHMNVHLEFLVPHILLKAVHDIAKTHAISLNQQSQDNRELLCELFKNHQCMKCISLCTIFLVQVMMKNNYVQVTIGKKFNGHKNTGKQGMVSKELDGHEQGTDFPPPLDDRLTHHIISDFCNALSPGSFEEAGCAVCGELKPL